MKQNETLVTNDSVLLKTLIKKKTIRFQNQKKTKPWESWLLKIPFNKNNLGSKTIDDKKTLKSIKWLSGLLKTPISENSLGSKTIKTNKTFESIY